jgi:hypothetical protein
MPRPNWPAIDHAIEVLNEALKLDVRALRELFHARVFVNRDLAHHAKIQVIGKPEEVSTMGVLGLINGLFGVSKSGWGYITAVYEDTDTENDVASKIALFRRTDNKLLHPDDRYL